MQNLLISTKTPQAQLRQSTVGCSLQRNRGQPHV
uniref:Uncharacterized protein n=1 Tax=Anguilla anguilla TaxID=7936 RepID=A0A0E9T441_ANGAN